MENCRKPLGVPLGSRTQKHKVHLLVLDESNQYEQPSYREKFAPRPLESPGERRHAYPEGGKVFVLVQHHTGQTFLEV